jgi:dGTPase
MKPMCADPHPLDPHAAAHDGLDDVVVLATPEAPRPTIRQRLEAAEATVLSPYAMRSVQSKGRVKDDEEEDRELRPAFHQDLDRIVQSKTFRRLAHKTQVFLAPEGDHYRTRITHTLEVAQVARAITSALGLHNFLAEAIAMGHDLGHTPFGHAGEWALAQIMPGGFHHARQSLRVVEQLENDGEGLNLTFEVRDGILKHSKGKGPIISDNPNLTAMTLEGQVVRVSDLIAYANHDLDDAIRAGLLSESEVPEKVRRVLGEGPRERARRLIFGVVEGTHLDQRRAIRMNEDVLEALAALRDFLYDRVYDNHEVHGEFEKAQRILAELWEHYHKHEDEFRARWWPKGTRPDEGLDRAVCDFLSGMTDRYALRAYEDLRLPKRWSVL